MVAAFLASLNPFRFMACIIEIELFRTDFNFRYVIPTQRKKFGLPRFGEAK